MEMKRMTEWMEWMEWMDGRTDGWMDGPSNANYLQGRYKMDQIGFIFFLKKFKKGKKNNATQCSDWPRNQNLCPQPQFPIGFYEYWKFGQVWFRLFFLFFYFKFFLESSSLVKDPHFILFLNFYPRNQEVASQVHHLERCFHLQQIFAPWPPKKKNKIK